MRASDDRLTGKILSCAQTVSRALGVGFLEKVYENALMVELAECGLAAAQQVSLKVDYRGQTVGVYTADIVVEGEVILELKAGQDIEPIHQAQLLNYLRSSGLYRGLILNFGKPRLGIKRMVLGSSQPSVSSVSSVA